MKTLQSSVCLAGLVSLCALLAGCGSTPLKGLPTLAPAACMASPYRGALQVGAINGGADAVGFDAQISYADYLAALSQTLSDAALSGIGNKLSANFQFERDGYDIILRASYALVNPSGDIRTISIKTTQALRQGLGQSGAPSVGKASAAALRQNLGELINKLCG